MIRVGLLLLACLLSGCASFTLRPEDCPSIGTAGPDAVAVQYLGAGGYLVQHDSDVVLFGPQFTNPGILEVTFEHKIRTDRALVDALLPAAAKLARAIIIGHAHYDHAMDTPYIATAHATKSTVYGSATLKHLIGSVVPADRMVDVGTAADAHGFLQVSRRLRLWPIRSQHSDQTRLKVPGVDLPLHQWRGLVTAPQPSLPETASAWAEGEVYAYVLDFMDGDRVVFRLYYQDSGTDRPIGYPVLADGRAVDVALLCIGGDIDHLVDHPQGIIAALWPRAVLLGHWESFFAPYDAVRDTRVRPIPGLNVRQAERRARAAMTNGQPIVPCPVRSVFHFPAG